MRSCLLLIRHLGRIDEDELLRADVDAVHVRQAAPILDDRAVDHDTVAAIQVLDEDLRRPDVKHRVSARSQFVRNGQVAPRTTADGELSERQLEMCRFISKSKALHPQSD